MPLRPAALLLLAALLACGAQAAVAGGPAKAGRKAAVVHKGRAPLKLALPRLGPLWPRPLQQGASDAERPLALVDRPAASRVPASPEPFADSETPVIWLRVHRF